MPRLHKGETGLYIAPTQRFARRGIEAGLGEEPRPQVTPKPDLKECRLSG